MKEYYDKLRRQEYNIKILNNIDKEVCETSKKR